jgi:hypothetical protein
MPGVRAFLAVTTVVLACASCQGDTEPTAQAPTETTTPETSSSTPTVPSYLATYGPDERAAFNAAVAAMRRFSAMNDRFLRQGKLTKQQAAFYRRNSVDWVEDWANRVEAREQQDHL